mgnify:CR=1 FL=1
MTGHIDWNDETVPVGKRKTVFVKWLMQVKKVPRSQARAMANSKFGASEASARRRNNREDDASRRREQVGIRQFGHPGQYDATAPISGTHDIAGLLARLSSPTK